MIDIFAEGTNSTGTFAAVFGADDDVGWFYLYKAVENSDPKIINAVHVLNGIPDFKEADVEVRWNDNESKVGLFIKSQLWAYYDVATERGFTGRYPKIPLKW